MRELLPLLGLTAVVLAAVALLSGLLVAEVTRRWVNDR